MQSISCSIVWTDIDTIAREKFAQRRNEEIVSSGNYVTLYKRMD